MAGGALDGEGMSSPGSGQVRRPGTPARRAYASSTPTAPMTRSSAPAARSGSPDAASDSASMSSTMGSRRCGARRPHRVECGARADEPSLPPERLGQEDAKHVELLVAGRAVRLAHGDPTPNRSLREGRQPGGELRPRQGQLVRHEVDHATGVLGDRGLGGDRLPRDRRPPRLASGGGSAAGGVARRASLPLTARTHRRRARSNRERDRNGPSTASRAAAGSR